MARSTTRVGPALSCGLLLSSSLLATAPAAEPYFRLVPGRAAGSLTGGPVSVTDPSTKPPPVAAPPGTPVAKDTKTSEELGELGVTYARYAVPMVGQDADGSWQVAADHATGDVTFSATGLPPGLSIEGEYGFARLKGIPTQAGSFPVRVIARDAEGATGAAAFEVVVARPASEGATFSVPDLDLFLGQPSPAEATYAPMDGDACVRFALKSGTLPSGTAVDPDQCHAYDARILAYGADTPTEAGTFGPIVLTATPDGGVPVDSNPFSVRVGQPELKVSATPLLVRARPGEFDGRRTFRGLARYGSQDLSAILMSGEAQVSLSGTVPAGLSWRDDDLSFDGVPTKAGERQVMRFSLTYAGQTRTSPDFVVEVRNILNPALTYDVCETYPPTEGPAGPRPGGTFCNSMEALPAPQDIPVAYDTDPFVRIADRGGQPIAVTLGPGSALPAGLTLNQTGQVRGLTRETGDHPVSFVVSAPGLPTVTMGPYTLRVGGPETRVEQPPDWFIPATVAAFVPYAGGPPLCHNPFPETYRPYRNVSAANLPPHMTVGPDGTVCGHGPAPDQAWEGETHTTDGTVTATTSDGRTHTKPVTFHESQTPH